MSHVATVNTRIKTYTFDELDEKAKEKAKYDAMADIGYAWSYEAIESLKKMAEHFGGKVRNYSINFFNSSYSSAKFDMPEDMEPHEIMAKLDELGTYNSETLQGHGDCKLTGYCGDESVIDGFRKAFFEGETDLEKLMKAGFNLWLKDAQADCEAQYEDDNFSEWSDGNEIRYLKNGERISKGILPDDSEVNATELETAMASVLKQIVSDLPQKRDWLDPEVEKQAKALIAEYDEQVS